MTCRTCRYLDVKPDRSGRRVPRKNYAYRCTVPLPEVKWPASVTTYVGFREPHKTMMDLDEGEDCPLYEELKK